MAAAAPLVDGELALGQFGGVAGRAAWLEVAGR